MLCDEYRALGLGERVARVAKSALLLEEFLAREYDGKRLELAFKAVPEKIMVHGHCHQKAFGAMKSMRKVLSLLPQVRAASADVQVIANGTSCRQQIRDGAQRESQHLAQVLRQALADDGGSA